MRKTLLVLAVFLAAAGCKHRVGGYQEPAAGDSSSSTSSSSSSSSSSSAAPSSYSSSSSGGSIGVSECDDYLQAFRDCIASKVPEGSRAELSEALEQNVATWRSAAASPEGRAGLAVACTQARDAAKPSVSAYGCSL
jgi:hypothetical protein